MSRRDPLIDRGQDADDRERASAPPGADLASNVAGLLEPNDPAPKRSGRERPNSVSARELGLEPLHVAEPGGATLGRDADRSNDRRFDRYPPEPRGGDAVP
jgi:hypothetical protein